jgi:hypothetical protein
VTPAEFSARILIPSVARFPFRDSPEARALLLAIAGVESGWTARYQLGGPALGFWQFEPNGIQAVLDHPASGDVLRAFCAECEVKPTLLDEALAWHDGLAYACARLLLWTDPAPLPAIGDQAAGWAYYERLWRPGKPDAARWATRYAEAFHIIAAPAVA